jgi:putative exosortase-associated protein (TIGR04073 family)
MRSKKTLVFLLALTLAASSPAFAVEKKMDDMWSKLGRGICNVLTGPLEIFNQPAQMAAGGERWPIAFMGGIFKGTGVMIQRVLVGVYEILTFPVPNTSGNFEPVMEPEFILPTG